MSSTGRPPEIRITVWLRGDAAMRLDAIAWFLWVESGRSQHPQPSRTEAVRVSLVEPDKVRHIAPIVHRCAKCGRLLGAPYCWEHGEKPVTPVPPRPKLVSEE